MNRKWLLITGLVALAIPALILTSCYGGVPTSGASSPVRIDLNNQQEGIWVSGQGSVTVVPDIASVSLGIESQAATVGEAQAEAAAAMERVMSALRDNGIAEKDIQTQYFNISKITRWDESNQQEVVIGYRVTNTVVVKIRDIETTGTIIDAAVVAGGELSRVNSVSFSIDDPTTYLKEARDEAMTDAKSKAEQLATLSGVRLGKPTYIAENLYYPPTPIYRDAFKEAAAPTTPISPGEMEITLSVQVAYAILD